MPFVTIVHEDGQIRITSDLPGDKPEQVVLLLAQALELARIPAIARQIAMVPPSVTLATPSGMTAGGHGIRGGEATFRRGHGGG